MNTNAALGSIVIRKNEQENITIDLATVLEINESDLTREYSQQAAQYGYFATMLARAERTMIRAETFTQRIYAQADDFWRNELKGMKFTEPQIKGLVLLDEEYIKAQDEEAEAVYNYKLIKALVDALNKKAEMLISLGAHIRAEVGMTGMTMREKKLDDSVKALKAMRR
jgi:hypothetical protein